MENTNSSTVDDLSVSYYEDGVETVKQLAKEIEGGKMLTEALESASIKLGRTGEDKITIEKFPC